MGGELSLERVAGTTHPALEFDQHQFIGAIHQAEARHGAIPLAAVVEGEMKILAAEATHLGITAHDHIQGGPKAIHPSSQL